MKKKIYLLCLTLWLTTSLQARTIRIALASNNNHKIAAVSDAFKQRFTQDTIEVISYKAASAIPAQPIGKASALLGITNRIAHLPDSLKKSVDYIVGIENYIEALPHEALWKDVGLITIHDTQKAHTETAETQPTFISPEWVTKALQQGQQTKHGLSITIGSIIKQELSQSNFSIDEHDWHSLPLFGGVARKQLLQDAISKALYGEELAFLKKQLAYHQDFPKIGICFVDIFPLLRNPKALHLCIELLAQRYMHKKIDVIVGLESRGFLLGAALASRIGAGFVPVRKPNKLPGETYTVTYEKEYGTDSLTIAKDALQPFQRILIMDDLIATGGSAKAAIKLIKKTKAFPVEFVSLVHVPELAQKALLEIPAFNLID